jgi:hypothetical protein
LELSRLRKLKELEQKNGEQKKVIANQALDILKLKTAGQSFGALSFGTAPHA